MSERRALGKGISALIPEKEITTQENTPQLKLEQIRPNPFQPREEFDTQGLEELTQSIREKGIIQPVLVRRRGDHYELIAGERRFRAAQMLKLEEIPVIIKDVEDEDSLELSLIENIQRQTLTPSKKRGRINILSTNLTLRRRG
jgi:ParB family chromosome partitioning protein